MRGLAALFLALAAFSVWVFHERYWRWRACFAENTQGRCWDGGTEQVHVKGAGLIWGGLAGLCLLAAAYALLARRWLRRRRVAA